MESFWIILHFEVGIHPTYVCWFIYEIRKISTHFFITHMIRYVKEDQYMLPEDTPRWLKHPLSSPYGEEVRSTSSLSSSSLFVVTSPLSLSLRIMLLLELPLLEMFFRMLPRLTNTPRGFWAFSNISLTVIGVPLAFISDAIIPLGDKNPEGRLRPASIMTFAALWFCLTEGLLRQAWPVFEAAKLFYKPFSYTGHMRSKNHEP